MEKIKPEGDFMEKERKKEHEHNGQSSKEYVPTSVTIGGYGPFPVVSLVDSDDKNDAEKKK